MFNINQFLGRIKSRQNSEQVVRWAVIQAIKEVLSVDLNEKDIEIKPPRVFLKNVSQTVKAEVFIKKVNILEIINKNHGGRPLIDIR